MHSVKTKPIHLLLSDAAAKLPAGASRLWGNPGLPEDVDFPSYRGADGEEYPYFFIAQVNLADVAALDPEHRLPERGVLAFFAKIDYYLGYDAEDSVGSALSGPEDVRVLYFPDPEVLEEVELTDPDGNPAAPRERAVRFSHEAPPYADEHILLAPPDHREWEHWDAPCEDWEILFQLDSSEGDDFDLNFMDCGVLVLLIDPEDLRRRDFSRVRAQVLST